MIGRLRALLRPHRGPGLDRLPRPSLPICLIGDIHGRADLLDRMLTRIAALPEAAQARIVVLGDMIDRGPDSAAVVARLSTLCAAAPDRWICLMGNHERMLLDFLADPAGHRRWLRYGAAATLASYGVTVAPDRPRALAEALAAAMPPAQRDWLAGLPLIWQADTLVATHAGADPRRPIHSQPERALLWGHPDLGEVARSDGLWIARGHQVVGLPEAQAGVLSLDTGAWRTGVLSAAWLDREGVRFLQVSG